MTPSLMESHMKVRNVVGISLIGACLSPLAFADALRNYPQQGTAVSSDYGGVSDTGVSSSTAPRVHPAPQGKTRQDVHLELVAAQRAGLIPAPDSDYPPSQRTIDRNKARFNALEKSQN
jgi:hypothetical protein